MARRQGEVLEIVTGAFEPIESARKGLAKVGHIPPQEKLERLRELGARFYACGPSMEHYGVKKQDLIHNGVAVAEYVTFMEVMKGGADISFFLQ